MRVAEERAVLRNRTPGRLAAVGWPALLLAIFVCFFWRLVFSSEYTWLDGPDFAYQVLPWYQFQAGEWHSGILPLWDPYLWGGQPLLAQMIPGAAYPPNWLVFLAPLRNGWIRQSFLHWYFVLIHFQGALFCYWLCRDLKRSHAASLLAGIVFGLGGYVGTNNWPVMLNGAVWAPLVFLFFLRAMRGERPMSSAAWSGAFLGISILSGHHQIPVFVALAMAGVWIYFLIADVKKAKLLLIFGLFVILVSAFQALPAYEYGKLSLRWVGAESPVGWKDKVPYSVHQKYALYPESILGIVIPAVFRNSDPFVGLVALTLALLGITAAWEDRTARLFGAIALGGLLFSLGHNSVFHGVLYALIPLVEKARNPAMASFIFHFGLCVLVAYGIDERWSVSDVFMKWTLRILTGFAGVVALMIWAAVITKTTADERLGIVVLAGLLLTAILAAWRSGAISSRGAIVSLALVMLLELGNVTTFSFPPRSQPGSVLKALPQDYDIAAFLKDQYEPVRVGANSSDVPYNFGDWYGIDHFGGYLASLTANVFRVFASTRVQMMYGTNFYLAKQPLRPDQVEVFTGRSGVKVYRNPGAFPRSWIVHDVFTFQREDQIGPLIEKADFDARRQTFVKGAAPMLEVCNDPETVSLRERQSGRLLLQANLKCRGMVIVNDTFFPGWVAAVDGQSTPIYEAYGFLRGVVVEAGAHRIEMRYRPASVYWGAALTLLGLLGAGGLAILKL